MKLSTVLKRFFAVCFCLSITALVISCTNKTSSSLETDLSARSPQDTQALAANSYITDTNLTEREITSEEQASIATRILASAGPEEIGIELAESDKFNQLTIQTDTKTADYKVVRLENPSRIVVDVLNQQARINRIFDTQDMEYIAGVRIGAHPDKSRIVVDLAQNNGLLHNVDTKGGAIILTVASPENMSDAMAYASGVTSEIPRLDTPDANPRAGFGDLDAINAEPEIANPVVAVVPEFDSAQRAALEDTEDTTVLEVEEPKLPTAAPKLEQPALGLETPVLRGLQVKQAGEGSNYLIAEMQSAGIFSLQKTAPSEYVVTLENAEMDPSVTPVLATPNSGDIRSVRPVIEGSNIQLRIFANAGSRLKATTENGNIVITSALPGEEFDLDEARAQFSENEIQGSGDSNPNEQEIAALFEDQPKYSGRLISLDLQDTDIDNALRIIAEVSNLNIIASEDVAGKVTLRLIDVPWDQALDVILKTNALDKVQEGNVIRIAPVEKLRQEREALKQAQQAEEELEAQQVRYIRVSYAKAAELQPLVETVLTERGTVSYDERTNQLIVKDIARGIKNVAVLVSKLDLRTPQVLLETQIVEASRTFFREMGTELGFNYIRSPETGNATGNNFPNSVDVSGSVGDGNVGSSFPAAVSSSAGSAVSFLLDSADGSQSLDMRISSLESEGRIRVVSRPSVATTNNTLATIKSVEKIRVKIPSGGLSVATGSGASAQGTSASATETIEIGIVLEVTPQASPDYYVLLDINAKSSTLGANVVEGIPSEVERSATSTVLVSSGQTFAMGGIYKISDIDAIDGVPFLKDIPFLGHLFRRNNVNNRDEELIFFITPRIVEGSFDDAAMKAVG
ncbi:MAG: type IV pilus secretin PilQ [Bdellovibrionota bacterium]